MLTLDGLENPRYDNGSERILRSILRNYVKRTLSVPGGQRGAKEHKKEGESFEYLYTLYLFIYLYFVRY